MPVQSSTLAGAKREYRMLQTTYYARVEAIAATTARGTVAELNAARDLSADTGWSLPVIYSDIWRAARGELDTQDEGG